MGNPDLIIIINGYKVIEVLGSEYDGNLYDMAIKIAIGRFRAYIDKLLDEADKPEEIDTIVRKIEVYEI